MGELICEIPVVGEKEEPLGVPVKATNRVHLSSQGADQVGNQGAASGVCLRAEIPDGLVEDQVETRSPGPDRLAINGDRLAVRVGLAPEGVDHPTVDGYPSLTDQAFRCPPRGDPGLR